MQLCFHMRICCFLLLATVRLACAVLWGFNASDLASSTVERDTGEVRWASVRSVAWSYYPRDQRSEAPVLGIVMGGSPDIFESFANITASIMLKYARYHGYAAYVDRDLGRYSSRHSAWNKILLIKQLLPRVPTLVWMDADIIIQDFALPLHERLASIDDCKATQQQKWRKYLPKRPTPNTFLIANADVNKNEYLINMNTGVFAVTNASITIDFLDRAWKVGNNPEYFKKHDKWWNIDPRKKPSGAYYGWPWEQGAFWEVLAWDPGRFLHGTCIAALGTLQSVTPQAFRPEHFALHGSGWPDSKRHDEALAQLETLERKFGNLHPASEIVSELANN